MVFMKIILELPALLLHKQRQDMLKNMNVIVLDKHSYLSELEVMNARDSLRILLDT